MPTYRYEGLIAWQEAFRLSMDLGQPCKRFPSHERLDLMTQLRRAARTVPSNIAEGANSQTISTNRTLALRSAIGEVDNISRLRMQRSTSPPRPASNGGRGFGR